jgi:GNAT superfamily N-acetyltransferase
MRGAAYQYGEEAKADGAQRFVDAGVTNTRIRSAVIGDAEQIAKLITELGYPTTATAMGERLTGLLADPDYATFVTDTDAGIVGVAGAALDRYYEKDGVYARLLVLAVSGTARGRGVGSQLVEAVERWAAADKGAREVFVNSGLHRREAHAFYERRGYSRTGFRFVKQLNDGAP